MDRIIAHDCRDDLHERCRADECECSCHGSEEESYTRDQLDELLHKAQLAARMEFLAELTQKAMKNNDMEVALWLMKHGRTQVGEM